MSSVLVFVLSVFTGGRHSDHRDAPAHPVLMIGKDSGLVVRVDPDPVLRLSEPLKMHWKISNEGDRPEFIYLTLLKPKNNALAEINIDARQRLFEIRFLRLNALPRDVSPNSFPDTEFKRIEPGQSIEGYFMSRKAIREITNTELTNADAVQEIVTARLTAGKWQTRSLIAYGEEIETVQADLKTLFPYGIGHPLAAITKWQKVAYSETTSVTFRK